MLFSVQLIPVSINLQIFFQALTLTSGARKQSTIGEIVNLMSIDAKNIQDFISYFWVLWSSPLQCCFSLYFLFDTMGISIFAGVGVLIILIPMNGIVISILHKLQAKQMRQKDNRIKLLSEVLNGIKVSCDNILSVTKCSYCCVVSSFIRYGALHHSV